MASEWFAGIWGLVIIAGPIILAIFIAYGVMRRRRRMRGSISPDYPLERQQAAQQGATQRAKDRRP
jgi:hypothetical protein